MGAQFWDIAKSGDDPQEDLARFGYKLNMKVKSLNVLLCFWLIHLNHVWKSGEFLLNFDQIMGIEKLKKALDFSHINF